MLNARQPDARTDREAGEDRAVDQRFHGRDEGGIWAPIAETRAWLDEHNGDSGAALASPTRPDRTPGARSGRGRGVSLASAAWFDRSIVVSS